MTAMLGRPAAIAGIQHAALATKPFAKPLATKPVVETYQSNNATIVEVPSGEASDDVKIVMIFDENLPADL